MQQRGLHVESEDNGFEVHPHVTGDLTEIGIADVILLGVKAHSLTSIAPQLKPLFGPDTAVVSTQNGIPWWYFQQHGGPIEGLRLQSVDPGGVIADSIEPGRVIGSLVYFASEIVAPGVIRHHEGNRISLGEPSGERTERCRKIAEALISAGFRCPITTRMRHEIWVKLLGNVAFNPISALTGATLAQMTGHPEVSKLARQMMAEAEAVAAKFDITIPITIDQRLAGAEKVGEHKTSMLQDLEAGRPLEIDAIVGAVVELAGHVGVAVPATSAVYACTKLLAQNRQRCEKRNDQ
jgi:2-dehydropantoate 2-reductase